jgi:hypothetical protein
MYCRFESGVHPREPLGDMLLAICDHSSSLEDHIRLLQKVYYTFHIFFLNSIEILIINEFFPSLQRITFLKEKLEESGVKKRDSTSISSTKEVSDVEEKIEDCMIDNKVLYEKESLTSKVSHQFFFCFFVFLFFK